MIRHALLFRILPKLFFALVIASLLASALPPASSLPASRPAPLGSALVQAAEIGQGLGSSALPISRADHVPNDNPIGSLRFSPVVDRDDNLASNPMPAAPAPVVRVGPAGSPDAAQDARYAVVALAVEVAPDSPAHNPAGAMVEFRLWNDAGTVELTRRARADAWGAAAAEFFLDDQHLAGKFYYTAAAAGYLATPERSFAFDLNSFSHDVQLGAASVAAQVEADGRLVVDVMSDVTIDDSLLAVQLTAARLVPTESGVPDQVLLPPLAARRLNDHQARAEIYLDPGDYLISASVASGIVEARSQPALVTIDHVQAPPIAVVEQMGDVGEGGESIKVQYRTPDGDVALLERAIADLPPSPAEPAAPATFQQTTRVGPFEWRTQVYSTTVETIVDDGKKLVTLDGFGYDPVARSYDITIQSLLAEPVEDTLTVQVYGPNGVVIYEESAPIWLDPEQPLHYQFNLPSDRGEPYGLRITVHDPLDFKWVIQKIGDGLTTLYNGLNNAVSGKGGVSLPFGLSFSLTAGFGFSLLVVEIDIATASIGCAQGACKPKTPTGLIFESGDWVRLVTDGVRAFLRTQYRDLVDVEDMDQIIEKLGEGITLGSLTISATASGRLTYTVVDPGACVSQQAIDRAKQYVTDLGRTGKDLGDAVTFRAKTVSEALQSKGKLSFPVPGAWFLGVQLTPVLAFRLKADKSGDFTVFAEIQVELGGKSSLKLKASAIYDTIMSLLNARAYFAGVYSFFETAKTGEKVLSTLISARAVAAGGGCGGPRPGSGGGGSSSGGGKRKNPPPPNGSPDDRRDAFQNQFPPDPRGVGGDIQSLQQQLAIAQDAGLARAATYFTVRLRRQELAAFLLDTSRAISYTAEMDAAYDSAYLQITGLISGTILPDPGETITDAVRSAFVGYFDDMANTSYDVERRTLLDSLEFAERQYALLRGQELDLQAELRQMFAAAGVGVLDSGLVESAIGAIGSLGVHVQPIEILAGSGRLSASRYLPPYQAPPVLIVPSGGLYRYGDSQEARAWLESYVEQGGTLIVLAQFDSADWELLPGGEVRGLGYDQDILCKNASVRIVNSSPWLTGLSRDLPDIQIDGSFTQWPADATILLMRTTGNLMPAMLEYPYGLGTVVATAAYPDFYMNGLQSTEDIVFARSLFGLAYLQATGQSLAANVAPNQFMALPVEISNTSAVTATQVTLYRDYYANNIGDSWRWAYHQPNPAAAAQSLALNPPLPSGASRTVTFDIAAPPQAGIFRLGYFLGSSRSTGPTWNVSGALPGAFYQVQSTPIDTDLFRFRLTTDQPAYDFGAAATVTATLFNDRASARTFTLAPRSGLSAAPVDVTVAPHSAATRSFTTTVDRTRQVRLAAVENDSTVSELMTTLRLRPPVLGISGSPEAVLAGVAASGVFTAAVRNAPTGVHTVNWEVRRNGVLLAAPSTPLVGSGVDRLAELTTALPAAQPDSAYTVRVALPTTSRAMTQTIPVLAPVEVRSATLLAAPVLDAANAGALLTSLKDPGYPGQFAVQALLEDEAGVLTRSAILAGSIGSGLAIENLDLPLPPTLTLGMTYTVVISATGQFAGSSAAYPDRYELPLPLETPQVSLSTATRNADEPLDVTIEALPDAVVLPAAGPFDLLLAGVSTYAYEPLAIEGITPLGSGGGVTLHTHIPSHLTSGGLYDVQVTSARLAGWQSHNSLAVPPHRIELAAPPSVAAGAVLTATLQNTGGVAATVDGTLRLEDRQGALVAETSFYVNVPSGSGHDLALPLPAQLKGDRYLVRMQATDQLSQDIALTRGVVVDGLAVELDSRTDQPAYLASDLIATTSLITPNQTLAGAALRLRVLGTPPEPTAWDGWRGRMADGGQSNAVSQTAAGPFTPSWSTTPGAYDLPPVAIDDLVITPDATSCASESVQALDSFDGSLRWGPAPLPDFPLALAANSQAVFVLTSPTCPSAAGRGQQPQTGYFITALDVGTGGQLWQGELNHSGELAASESTVVMGDFDANGYRVLDAVSGDTRAVYTDTVEALLVDDRLFLEDTTDVLAAYDALTGAALWSSAMPEGSFVLAATDTRVLSFQEYDTGAFDLVNLLHVYDAATGAEIGSVALTRYPYTPDFALLGDTFYYLAVDTGGGTRTPDDVVSTLFAADLSGLTETVVFTSEHEITTLVGSGDRLHLLDTNDQALLSIDANGALLGQTDLSAIDAYAIDRLIVHQQGLLALAYGGQTVYALQASGPVYGGSGAERAIAATSVLREDWLAVDGSGLLSLPLPLTNPDLGDNPLARGLLYLEGVLFGAEPAAASQPASRQRLASSLSPFTVDNALTSVTLTTDRPSYRRNVTGYGADDALSTVALAGRVRNTGLSPDDVSLHIERSDGATLLTQTFAAVGPNETRVFSVSDPAPPAGAVVYTATTSLGHSAVAKIQVTPAAMTALSTVTPGSIALGEQATLQVSLATGGGQPGVVTVDLGDGPQVVTLASGESAILSRSLAPAAGGELALPVVFDGDISRTDTLTLTVRDESAAASIALSGTIRSLARAHGQAPQVAALVQGANAGLELAVQNTQPFSFDAIVDYSLAGPESRAGSVLVTLLPGPTSVPVTLGALPTGEYTAAVVVRHARLGNVIGSASLSFSVVSPLYDLAVTASAGEMDADGRVVVAVSAASAASSEQPWAGALLIEDGGDQTRRELLELAPGSTETFSATLALRNRAGPQTLHAALVDPDGAIVAEQTVTIDGPARLAPAARLTSLTASAGSPGGPVTLTATLDNEGPAGDAALSFLAFDQTVDVLADLPAYGLRTVTQVVTAPAGLLAGRYPAEVHLGDQMAKAEIVLSGAQIDVDLALDAASYEPFSLATWTATLSGVSGGPASYDVVMRYVTQSYTRTVTLGAGQTVAVPWTFDVGPASNRATVIVQPHLAGASAIRFALAIDSQWVPVIEDPSLWLESDKARYQAGETVHLTLHVLQPTDAAYVLRPEEIESAQSPLLWSNVLITSTWTITEPYALGDFAIDYTLPATLRTGRYFFVYGYDAEERTLPIDVFGVTLLTKDYAVRGGQDGPLAPGDPVTVTANLYLDTPVASALLVASDLAPDGTRYDLGPLASLTRPLPAGVTPITLRGVLPSSVHGPQAAIQPGAHQIELLILDAGSLAMLGGDAAFVDVGAAAISDLSTDRGVYTPGQPGTATLVVYGSAPATVHVETSGGTVLLDQNVALSGFQSLQFAIPTAAEGDEVLIGTVTDSLGLVSTLQAAYKVAATLDTTPPEVKILSPANGAAVIFDGSHLIDVSGIVTEETEIDTVLVNGVSAAVMGNAWTATISATLGANLIQAIGQDAAGNPSAPDLVDVTGEPQYGISFTVAPTTTAVNGLVSYTAVVTSSEPLTATVLFPFSVEATAPTGGSATAGTLSLDAPVSWEGVVGPGQPATIQWQGVATEPISRTLSTLVQGPQMLPRFSQDVAALVIGSPLAATLVSFEAQVRPDHILVSWETNSEINNLGFNLYRGASAAGPGQRLNELLIPSQSPGSPGGFIYTWEDRAGLQAGATYFYWIEDVDVDGTSTRHGPISVEFSTPTAVRVTGISTSSMPNNEPSIAMVLLALLLPAPVALAAVRRRRVQQDSGLIGVPNDSFPPRRRSTR